MLVTLLRHGRAADRETWVGEDADRPLTSDGVARCERIFTALAGVVPGEQIWTSPWKRARETADLAAHAWDLPIRMVPELAGDAASAEERIQLLSEAGAAAPVLVGHEPDLSELAAGLCGGGVITLKKAGVVVLSGDPRPGGMACTAVLTPRLVFDLVAQSGSPEL